MPTFDTNIRQPRPPTRTLSLSLSFLPSEFMYLWPIVSLPLSALTWPLASAGNNPSSKTTTTFIARSLRRPNSLAALYFNLNVKLVTSMLRPLSSSLSSLSLSPLLVALARPPGGAREPPARARQPPAPLWASIVTTGGRCHSRAAATDHYGGRLDPYLAAAPARHWTNPRINRVPVQASARHPGGGPPGAQLIDRSPGPLSCPTGCGSMELAPQSAARQSIKRLQVGRAALDH